MRSPRSRSALLCASLFAILSLILLTGSDARAQAVSKETRAYAESLTQSLMALHAQYREATPAGRAALKLQLRSLAAERQQFLSSLIQTSPGEVLRVAMPNEVSANM